jgi:hypothetical protein
MANLRIITPNESDDAVLTAVPAMVTTLPVSNLQDQTRSRVARSVGLPTPQYIRGDYNEVKQISSMALVRHNLTGAAEIRLKLWDGAGQTGTLTYDSGVVELGDALGWGDFIWGVDPWGDDQFANWPVAFTVLWFDPFTAQSFEIQITDNANTDGYIEFARLFMGLYWSPETNFSYGAKMAWRENSTQGRTDGGTLRTDARSPYRAWSFDLNFLTQGERAQLADIMRNAGLRNDMFISCFPGEGGARERDYAGAAKLVSLPDITHPFARHYSAPMVLEEA